jgi:hypothetical protein
MIKILLPVPTYMVSPTKKTFPLSRCGQALSVRYARYDDGVRYNVTLAGTSTKTYVTDASSGSFVK